MSIDSQVSGLQVISLGVMLDWIGISVWNVDLSPVLFDCMRAVQLQGQ